MKINSKTNTLKGHIFDVSDPETLPGFVRRMPIEKQKDWAERETQRNQVVETCKICERALIAEEVKAHKLNHVEYTLRPLARMLADLPLKARAELTKLVKEATA